MAKVWKTISSALKSKKKEDHFLHPQQIAVTKQLEHPNPGVHHDELLESEDDSVSLVDYDQNSPNLSGPADNMILQAKSENERKRRRRKDNTSKNHQVRRQKPGDSLNKQEMTPIAGWKQDTSKGSHTDRPHFDRPHSDKPHSDRENKQPVTEHPKSIKHSGKKEKVIKRGERKFMQGDILVDGQYHLPPTKSVIKDFTTKSGIKVSVYKADITQLVVDAIVNAANERLTHDGGVAAAISNAAGCDLEIESDEYTKENGPLKVTKVALTTGGNLPCKKVIHAVGPRWKDYQNKTECQQHLEQTVFNSLKAACSHKFQSLAVSSFSPAIFGVPKEICARMYLASIQRFDELHGGSTSLQHIHFVDVNDDMVNIIQDSFTQLWDTLVTPSVSKNSINHPVEPTPESKNMFGNETQANPSKNHQVQRQKPGDSLNKQEMTPIAGWKQDTSEGSHTDRPHFDRTHSDRENKQPVTEQPRSIKHSGKEMTNPNSELKSHESEKGEAVKATNEGAWNMDNKNEVLRNGNNLLFQSETSAGSITPPNSKPTVSSVSLSATPFSSLPLTNTSTGTSSSLTITSTGTSATLTVTSTGSSAPVTTTPTSNSVIGTTKSTDNSLTLTSKDFITTSGIKVIVNKEDITKLKVDAIVNATDVYLTHSGGVSLAIVKAAGSNLKAEGDKYISEHGQLRVSDVVVTTAGNLPCQKVLNTVGPCWDNYQDKTRCQQDLIQTVFNCLEKAHSLGLTSLAVCCISSATFGIPKEICAEMYLRALKRFSQQHKNTSLKQIHFVDVNDPMVHVIQETFSKNWDNSNKPLSSGLHTLETVHYDNQDVTSLNLPRLDFSQDVTSLNLPRLDFSQDVYCFSFSCLVLVFQRKKITEINTDAIFFWKQAESIFDDETRKQIIDISGGTFSNEDMRKMKKKLRDGCVDHTITANGKMLLFSVVQDNKICQDDVCHTMETLLFQVNKEKRKTIAIPETFYSRETASSSVSGLEAFASGVYTAVEHYTHWPIKSVIEVHVLETNPDNLKTMVDTISLKVATDESVIETKKNQRPKIKDDDESYSAEMISELSATQKKELVHKKSNLPLNQTSVTLETKTETKMETDASDEDMEIPASHTDRTPTTFQTEIPLSQYKALVYLYREEFSHLFDVVLETGENMIVRARDDIAFKEIKEKMNTIRVERMKLPSDLVSDFEDTLKANAKTVHVFCLPNPDQGEVDIFSLDYGSMVKAKHLLNVTVGHIKVTSRSKRKFDHRQGEGNEDDGQLPSKTPIIVSKTLTPKDFKTESGIRVSVYKADITQLTVDAIVSAANEELTHGGGVAFAIARAAGFDLTDEGDKYIKVHGTQVTNVIPTTAGNLPCKKVLHAVGPYWGDYQDKALCQQHLAQTIFNALETAHKLKFATLAMCSIGSAIFAVPKDICARMYLAAVQRFDQQQGGGTSLQHIHFVDVSDEMVGIIQDTFTRLWDTSVIPPNSQPPVTGSLSKHGNASSKMNSKITSDVGEVRSQISHSTSPAEEVSIDTSCVICHSPMTDPKTLPCKHDDF